MTAPKPYPKRVLFVGPGRFAPGVWDTRARYIISDLLAPLHKRAEIHFLTQDPPEHALGGFEHLEKEFGIVHHTPRSLALASLPAFLGTGSSWLASAWSKGLAKLKVRDDFDQWLIWTRQAAQKIKPDVITHAHGLLLFGKVATQVAQERGIRSVVRVPGDEVDARLHMQVYAQGSKAHQKDLDAQDKALAMADAIVAMSEREKQRLRALGHDRNKIFVCPRGVDTRLFEQKPQRAPQASSKLKFLFLGRQSREKGYDLIEAAAKGFAAKRNDIEFIFAGSFEPGSEGNRHYLGFVNANELPALLKSVDAFILPSRTEGFPQALAEAMASGLPCIASRHLFETQFADGKDLLLTDLTTASLSQAIEALADEPNLRKSLGDQARLNAVQQLDMSLFQARYASLLLGSPLQP